MFYGLKLMTPEERAEIAQLAGLSDASLAELDPDQVKEKIADWIAGVVGCPSGDFEAVERATLNWMARELGVEHVDEEVIERQIRQKIASGAAEFLAPAWHLACAMAAVGPAEAVPMKVELLESAASRAVPSHSTRQLLLLKDLSRLCQPGVNPVEEITPSLEKLKTSKDQIEHALVLSIVVSLADGRLAVEEEQLYRQAALTLGVTVDSATALLKKINNLFWSHLMDVEPKNVATTDPETSKRASLRAAELTLSSAGVLDGLVLGSRNKVIQGESANAPPPKAGWKRLLGSMGSAPKKRPEQASQVMKAAYLAIVREHVQAVAENERRLQEEEEAARKAAAAAAAARVTEESGSIKRRSIKLNP